MWKLNTTLKLKLVYFFLFANLGVLAPYLPVFFEYLSFSKFQIGVLTMLPSISCFLIAPSFGFIGDNFNAHGELLIIALVVSTATGITIAFMRSFNPMLVATLITAVFRAPVTPQVDGLTMALIEDKTIYGSIRLWGSISFAMFSLIGGILTTPSNYGNDSTPSAEGDQYYLPLFIQLFYISCVCSIIAGYVIISIIYEQLVKTIPTTENVRQPESGSRYKGLSVQDDVVEPQKHLLDDNTATRTSCDSLTTVNNEDSIVGSGSAATEANQAMLAALKEMVRLHPESLVFALVVLLSGIADGVIAAYLFLYIKELGGSGFVMGVARFVACVAEIPTFQVVGKLQEEYGAWLLLCVTQAAFVVRFLYYTFLSIPWTVVPCELLHGLTFAVTWSVACTYANEIAPAKCQSFLQALLEGLHFGLGYGLGALLGGFAYDRFGAVRLFEACGIMTLCSLSLSVAVCMFCVAPTSPITRRRESCSSCMQADTVSPDYTKCNDGEIDGDIELEQLQDPTVLQTSDG